MQSPKPSDRAQVQSKEVRLPDSGTITLDDQDVQIVSFHFFLLVLDFTLLQKACFYFFLRSVIFSLSFKLSLACHIKSSQKNIKCFMKFLLVLTYSLCKSFLVSNILYSRMLLHGIISMPFFIISFETWIEETSMMYGIGNLNNFLCES